MSTDQQPFSTRSAGVAANRTAALVLGLALLVLGGMNLFTNLLQIQAGQWQNNVGIAAVLMLVFAGIPAGLGAWLVMSATGGQAVRLSKNPLEKNGP